MASEGGDGGLISDDCCGAAAAHIPFGAGRAGKKSHPHTGGHPAEQANGPEKAQQGASNRIEKHTAP